MRTSLKKKLSYKEKKLLKKKTPCYCCTVVNEFAWRCRCGFTICQDCLLDNFWGMSCNGITWECPDCGSNNGLGNQ